MGEESSRNDYEDLVGRDDDGDRVTDWATGLPSLDDLTPLSQPLVPPDLASAFSISPEPARTILDVHRASQSTFSSLSRPPNYNPIHPENQEAEAEADDPSVRALKRPRLVWTPQLHKRFVDVVSHLGIKNAVPKTTMQLMNVEGLTRENVASHLQKYRLYLKRMQGLSNEGPSPSDQLFSSTPVPPSLQEAATMMAPATAPPPPQPQPYSVPMMFPVPVNRGGHNGHTGMVPMNNSYKNYGGFADQGGRDWLTGGSKFGSFVSYPPHRVSPNEN